MIEKEIYYNGSLRVINPRTLQAWKDKGWYQEKLDQGYIYASGCGRFRTEVCTCWKCRKEKPKDENRTLEKDSRTIEV